MKKCFSRMTLPGLAALILLTPALVRADTITTFYVSGTAGNSAGNTLGSCLGGATCPFSGTLQVDVTAGAIDGLDITFPGLGAFDTLISSGPTSIPDPLNPGPYWEILAYNSEGCQPALPFCANRLDFIMTTAPTPGSLVGFTGGNIPDLPGSASGIVEQSYQSDTGHIVADVAYGDLVATITPVPEPSSFVLLAGGIAWMAFGLARRKFASVALAIRRFS